jgi:hypothetical protein
MIGERITHYTIYEDSVWARRDPDLMPLHGEPEFERLFPETAAAG